MAGRQCQNYLAYSFSYLLCRKKTEKEKNHMLPEKQKNAFRSFYDSARNNDILDPKTTLLIHFASAMAFNCYP